MSSSTHPLISIIVPVYKAENCLDELYQRLKTSLETISPDFEIILVEDCGGAILRGLKFDRLKTGDGVRWGNYAHHPL